MNNENERAALRVLRAAVWERDGLRDEVRAARNTSMRVAYDACNAEGGVSTDEYGRGWNDGINKCLGAISRLIAGEVPQCGATADWGSVCVLPLGHGSRHMSSGGAMWGGHAAARKGAEETK